MVTPSRVVQAVPDDPNDDHLLAAALEGRAAFLVTGDGHASPSGSTRVFGS
jgi:predicted nucleic acid-binding protein